MFKQQKRTYEIKKGYQPRQHIDRRILNNASPSVYELAIFIAERGEFKYIVDIGTGDGEQLKRIKADTQVVKIDYASSKELIDGNLPNAQVIDFNREEGIPSISEEILKDAVVISADILGCIEDPHKYLTRLSQIAKIAPFVLVSTPDRTRTSGPEDFGPPKDESRVREWTIDELYSLLKGYGINCTTGYTINNKEQAFKGNILSICGTQAIPVALDNLETVQAIMSAYNEEDIIEQSIKHLVSQGVDVHVIDNWSTDSTMEIVEKLSNKYEGVTYEHFPATKPKKSTYEWRQILTRVEEVAAKSKYDWILHYDSDELRITPWPGISLRKALSFVSRCGYNAIDFTVVDFRPTKDGYNGTSHPDTFFHSFEFGGQSGNFVQVKGWKNIAKVDLASTGGHMAEFKGRKVFPLKFINKHYPLRSVTQAKRKIFKDRKSRFTAAERKLGMHVHYDKYNEDDSYVWNDAYLNRYTPEYFYLEYMVELISGIGVKRLEDGR